MLSRIWKVGTLLSLFLVAQPGSTSTQSRSEGLALEVKVQLAGSALPDAIADRVLGQEAFNTNTPGTSADTMWLPAGIAIAPLSAPNAGRLFVVEYGYFDGVEHGNHRVLSWPSAASFTNGQVADLVIGQENFTSGDGALAADRFYGPEAAVVDAAGNLWVADTENNRVLRFDHPLSSGMDASLVLGQPNYDIANLPNQGGTDPAANTLYWPRGLALDAAGNLYVADDNNNRVLRFSPPFNDNMLASLVIGQADFNTRDSAAGESGLNRPKGIAMDMAGNLYVAEHENNRVTRFAPPFMDGMEASGVYGQPDYTSTGENTGGIGPASLWHPVDIAVSADGEALFVTDQYNVRVLGYSNPLSDSVADQVYGQPDFYSSTANNGGVGPASINYEPLGVAVDSGGSLYHADFRNNRLLAYDPDIVGDGTPGSCSEAAFDAALIGGGSISFNCGTTQINLSSTKSINAIHTTIDGGGLVTLSGQDAYRLFVVNSGAALTLRDIVLTDGYIASDDGGAIHNSGRLILENSTIRDSQAGWSGGAVVSYGEMWIIDSLLEGNQALNGGALYPRWNSSYTTITNSVLRDNHATDTTNGWGGAILVWDGASVVIHESDISNNNARNGGGIYNFANSPLTIINTTLGDNTATTSGGGLHNAGSSSLIGVTLSGNTAGDSGGALFNTDVASLTNSTLSANSAGSDGGGLENFGTVSMTNVTLSGNSAVSGGGIHNFDALSRVALKNSIVANSPIGGNCGGADLTNDDADKYSLSSDGTCGLVGIGSQNNVDPILSDLGDYGGRTQVHMLELKSPAIDGVAGDDAPSLDQRGLTRPQGNGFDIGAVERQPSDSDLPPSLFLPMVVKT